VIDRLAGRRRRADTSRFDIAHGPADSVTQDDRVHQEKLADDFVIAGNVAYARSGDRTSRKWGARRPQGRRGPGRCASTKLKTASHRRLAATALKWCARVATISDSLPTAAFADHGDIARACASAPRWSDGSRCFAGHEESAGTGTGRGRRQDLQGVLRFGERTSTRARQARRGKRSSTRSGPPGRHADADCRKGVHKLDSSYGRRQRVVDIRRSTT